VLTSRILATVMVAGLLLTGCSTASSSEGDAAGDTLRLGLFVPPTTFAAQNANWGNESPYVQAVYDTLLISDTDGAPQPHLATEWAYNDDNTVLTLELRDDVVFSDGTPFTADVAAQNLLRFRDGTSPNAAYGASIADAAAVDDDTLQITLTAQDPAFLGYLAFNLGAQESPAAFDAADIQTNPVGSGPYLLDQKKTVAGSSYHLTANPDYWAPELQHYDELYLNIYQDATAMLSAIQGGQLDAANLANNDNVEQIEAAGYTVSKWEQSWYGLFLFDRAGALNPALADVRVRQAINFAIDSDGMLQVAGNGFGTQTGQVFPERSVAFDPALDSYYEFDPEKAKDLLNEAGYADGLTIEMPSSAYFGPDVFTLIQQQLSDVGITVNYTDTGNTSSPTSSRRSTR
jgi:peptide/nickel transport system substrate-binding protein